MPKTWLIPEDLKLSKGPKSTDLSKQITDHFESNDYFFKN